MPVGARALHGQHVVAGRDGAAAPNELHERGIELTLLGRELIRPVRVELGGHDGPEDFLAVLPSGVDDFHVAAERLELGRRVLAERLDGGIDGGVAEVRRPRDVQALDLLVARAHVRARLTRQRVTVAIVGAGDHVEGQRRVAHGPRDRSGDAEVFPPGKRRMLRDAAPRRLEAVDPAEGRGDPQRAAAVGAERDRTEPARHGRRGAAARSARCHLEVPWVSGDAEQRVVGHGLVAELRRVGLAQEHRARRAQPARGDRVFFRHRVAEEPRAAGRAQAAREDHVLERQRHAVESADRLALDHGDLGFAGVAQRDVAGDQAERVQPGIERLDPGQDGFGDFDGGDLLGADRRGEIERRAPQHLVVRHWSDGGTSDFTGTAGIVSSGS